MNCVQTLKAQWMITWIYALKKALSQKSHIVAHSMCEYLQICIESLRYFLRHMVKL